MQRDERGARGARRARRRRARGWGPAPAPPPRAAREELDVHTEDGAVLHATIEEPAVPVRGVFVLAHALFARGASLGREGALRALLLERGYRVVGFDFRGHGASRAPMVEGRPRAWTYDDLVRVDVPAIVELARAKSDGLPVLVAGHSLGGHVALAAHGTGRTHVDGFLVIATSLWMPEVEPSLLRRAAKRAFAAAALPIVDRLRVVPARRLRLGSDDAPAPVARDLLAAALGEPWRGAGGEDYLAALARVEVPVCAVTSEGDRLACPPGAGAAFARRCRGPVEVLVVARSDDGGPPPGHMELATTGLARSTLERAVAWLDARTHVGEADLAGKAGDPIA